MADIDIKRYDGGDVGEYLNYLRDELTYYFSAIEEQNLSEGLKKKINKEDE